LGKDLEDNSGAKSLRKTSFFGKLFDNFYYKLAALLLGTLAWYIIQSSEILAVNHPVQVTLVVPDGIAIKGSNTRFKDATVRGSRGILGDLAIAETVIEAKVYVPKDKRGDVRILLGKHHLVNWNDEIEITIHDPYINIVIDEEAAKVVPIQEHFQGVPADGYMIEKTTITPSTVRITGLKSELKNINEVTTEAIDVTGIQQTKNFEALLYAGDLPLSNFSTDKVTVSVLVGEKKVNQRFSSIPIEVQGTSLYARVHPNVASIVVQGTPAVLNFIGSSDLRAFLDARDLTPGRYERKIQVQIPPDTALIETSPKDVVLEIFRDKKMN
jgi:hypothetical protein